METTTYIIIVTFNGMSWIEKCLTSCIKFNVIVVDNASTDSTVEFIENNFSNVTVFPQSQNKGFGQANNIGIDYALKRGADYLFLMNQDVYLINNCLDKLVDVAKKNKDFGILSPIHLNGNGDKLDKNFSYYLNYDKNKDFYSDAVLNKLSHKLYEVPFVNAAAWLLSRSTIEKIGKFDPIFFHYGEDFNFCQRVIYHKLKVGVASDIFIIHDRVESKIKEGKRFSDRYFVNVERRYKMKWADVNKEDTAVKREMSAELSKLNKEIFKSILKLNFSKISNLKKEKGIIYKVRTEITKSRILNKDNYKSELD